MYNYDSLWRTMKERGVTTYSLVNHYNISSHTMSNIRHNENITVETLHRLCQILHCQASDIVEITFDEEEKQSKTVSHKCCNMYGRPASETVGLLDMYTDMNAGEPGRG